MRKYAFDRFCVRMEEKVRKAINAGGTEGGKEVLLKEICGADDMFTSRQLQRLFAFAFRI